MTILEFLSDALLLQDDELNQRLLPLVHVRHLKKGELLIREEDMQTNVYFLMNGVLRGYFIDGEGCDITDCFCVHCGQAAMSCLSLDAPSPISIEAVTESDILSIPVAVAVPLLQTELPLIHMYNRMLLSALSMHWELKTLKYQCTAMQRYQWFLQNYPGLIDTVSNKHIATFLGMTPVTLSRLRRELRENGLDADRASDSPSDTPACGGGGGYNL